MWTLLKSEARASLRLLCLRHVFYKPGHFEIMVFFAEMNKCQRLEQDNIYRSQR